MAFLLTAELAPALRADLAEYTLAAVEELLGPAAMGAVRRERRVPGLVKAREVSRSGGRKARLAVHVRLFLLGDEVEAELIDEALPSVSASAALRDELLKGGRARFQVVPTAIPSHLPIPALVGKDAGRQDVLIASDWGELAGVTPRPDHVMHVGGATRTLASLATYWPGSRVLDVGTGCGVHAIFAALSGARVTATDVSKKALSYAEFNAALAGVSLDLREGSLLEPADGHFTNNVRPIHSPKDMKGLKFRVMQSPIYVKMVEAMGASATPLASGEIYTACQTNVVDGQENPLPTFASAKLQEVQKYVILTGHVMTPALVVINEAAWQKLEAADREILKASLAKNIEWQNNEIVKQEKELIAALETQGITVITPDVESFRVATLKTLPPLFEAKWGKGTWESIQDIQ